jgi:hypothetical protein
MNRDERNDADDVLRGLAVPGPPAGLRERALAAALRAEMVEDRWLRLLRNRPARLAWAAAVALLALLHVALSIREPSVRAREPGQQQDDELTAIVTLPPVLAAVMSAHDDMDSDDEVVR